MSHTSASGTITDVFGHRFVMQTRSGKILADIGPKASETVTLKPGDHVRVEGERKPTEIKVARIAIEDGAFVPTQHGDKHHDKPPFSADEAKAMADAEGFHIVGELRAKKKHYEAHATKGSRSLEIHIHRDGVHEH